MALTAEELNAQFNTQVREAFTGVITSVKKYVDGKDEVLKSEIADLVVKELTDVEGLGSQLEKIQEMADAFAKVFDSDEDGKITPEEILAKITALQSSIDKVASDLEATNGALADHISAYEEAIKGIGDRIGATEVSISQNRDGLANLKANLETNYYTKDEITSILEVKKDEILDEVNDILFPDSDVE